MSEEYRVQAWFPDGTEAFTLTLDIEPVPKTPEEIAEEKAYMEAFFGQMGGQGMTDYQPKPFRDMIVNVDIGPDGNIWVQRGTIGIPLLRSFRSPGQPSGAQGVRRTGLDVAVLGERRGDTCMGGGSEEGYQRSV